MLAAIPPAPRGRWDNVQGWPRKRVSGDGGIRGLQPGGPGDREPACSSIV